MTSTKERQQRAAARAKLAREMTERQEAARRRRQRQAAIGAAAALVLIVGGVAWGIAALSGDEESSTPSAADGDPAPDGCVWLPEQPGNPYAVDVGEPPTDVAEEGTAVMSMTTNLGLIEVEMDAAAAPCTVASFQHLAANNFYDDTICHRMVTEGIFVLQCGDPSGTGMGGPTYRFGEENLPLEASPAYPAGTVAMAKTQAPDSTGSQFFIVYEDTELPPDYTVVGTVTQGLDIVQDVAADGAVDPDGNEAPDGTPNTEVQIETLTVSDPA